MIIETLKEEDIPALLNLYKNLVSYNIPESRARNVYKNMLLDDKYLLLVAKENNEIIGSILGIVNFSLTLPFLVIEDVIVKENARNKGVGRKLITKLDEFAKSKNCDYAIVVSSGFRKTAHKFYENVGFVDDVKGFRKLY